MCEMFDPSTSKSEKVACAEAIKTKITYKAARKVMRAK